MPEPVVTVVIPAYDVAPFLGEAIESVLAQTAPAEEIEIVVVDDGSTDDGAAVAAGYAPRVRCLRQPNRGLSAARNAGVRAARGAWLAFLDGDDRLWPDSIAARLAVARARPDAGLVYSGVRYVDVDGAPLPQHGWTRIEGDVLRDLVVSNRIHVHQALVRRDAVVAAGGFDETLRAAEDWDLWLRLSRAGIRWACVDAPLCDYRIRPGAMHRDPSRMTEALLRVVERVFADATLPADVAALRPLALHTTHLTAACSHYRGGDPEGGARHFRAAVAARPELVGDAPALREFCRRLLPVGYQRSAIAAVEWRRLTAVLRHAIAAAFADPDLAAALDGRRGAARAAVWRTTATLVRARLRRLGRAQPHPPLPA